MLTKIILFATFVKAAVPLIFDQFYQFIQGNVHYYTYSAVENPRNIVIIGGSYGGLFLAKRLSNSIPTGYRVILIEKRSHFNFIWMFPRISVVEDHEHKWFIPYDPSIRAAPSGAIIRHRGTAVAVDGKAVTLQDGTVFEYEYLVIATGSTGSLPWNSVTDEKRDGVDEFRHMQKEIRKASNLVIVGGGAVGVELASDIKSMYPLKNVSLVHSRDALLNTFGPKLQRHCLKILDQLGVRVYLGERVSEESGNKTSSTITLKSGITVPYDLFIKCTGQKPASGILSTLSPSSISDSGTILVKKTLQIADSKYPHIYALGDVAETKGVKMGVAAFVQGTIVARNITSMIEGKALKEYQPIAIIESAIDMTLGLTKGVAYFRGKDEEFLIPKTKKIALDSEKAWRFMGARPFDDKEYEMTLA